MYIYLICMHLSKAVKEQEDTSIKYDPLSQHGFTAHRHTCKQIRSKRRKTKNIECLVGTKTGLSTLNKLIRLTFKTLLLKKQKLQSHDWLLICSTNDQLSGDSNLFLVYILLSKF